MHFSRMYWKNREDGEGEDPTFIDMILEQSASRVIHSSCQWNHEPFLNAAVSILHTGTAAANH